MAAGNFKVIIVGGGPVGLTATHALRLAGIDYILLERRESVVLDVGAALAVGAGNLRVLHQLGLLETINRMGSEFEDKKVFTADGSLLKDSPFFRYMRRNHGTGPVAIHRAELLKALYDELPENEKAKILTGKRIVDIITDDHGVKVTCADGSVYEGSIVLGADGVHSKTRSLMRRLALEFDMKKQEEWDPEEPFTTTYQALWCSFPPSSQSGQIFETHHQDHCVMCIAGREENFLLLCQKLPEPTRGRIHFTDKEKDMQALVDMCAEFPVTETLKVKDVYARRIRAGMNFLEEGSVNHRHWGRIVLIGDSCNKMSPNGGSGYQNGIQDIADLCNKLHRVINETPDGLPSSSVLTRAFESYETYRSNALQADATLSSFILRVQTWASWFHYIMSRYIMTWDLTDYILLHYVAPSSEKKALVLDYVEAEEPYEGRVEWDHKMKSPRGSLEKAET